MRRPPALTPVLSQLRRGPAEVTEMNAQERKAAYRRRADKGEAIPVTLELPADLDTPLSAYLKLGGSRGFILESCYGGERFGRYSHVGTSASGRLRLDRHGGTFWQGDQE